MLSAVDKLGAPSEHSVWAQNCNDDGRQWAVGEYDSGGPRIFILSSCLCRELKNTGVIWKGLLQLLQRFVLNTQNLVLPKALLAFTGMNSHTYSACIESLEVPYGVMFLHLISTSIRAVDDLQSS